MGLACSSEIERLKSKRRDKFDDAKKKLEEKRQTREVINQWDSLIENSFNEEDKERLRINRVEVTLKYDDLKSTINRQLSDCANITDRIQELKLRNILNEENENQIRREAEQNKQEYNELLRTNT